MAATLQTRPNKFGAKCADCGQHVPENAGDLTSENGRWTTRHVGECPAPKAAREPVTIEDGMYRTEDGSIYKVQHAVHGSGNQYAKHLVVVSEPIRDEAGTIIEPAVIEFVYAPGAVTRLTPDQRMTLDEAKHFGALYGTCVRCGRTLTREDSIERMMGPVCATKI